MRVALVRLSALGDIIHTWPLALELKRAQPGLDLTWLVEEPLRLLVEGHPAVDRVITVASKRWRRAPLSSRARNEWGRFRSALRRLEPDLCLDPQGVFKSAVACRLSGAPRRVGLARPWRRELLPALAYTETLPVTGSQRHVVRTNLEMIRAIGGRPPETLPAPDGRWLLSGNGSAAETNSPARPYALLLPGAGRPDKLVPSGVLAEVARSLGFQGLETTVAWGPGERDRAQEVADAGGSAARLAPPTDLRELLGLLAGASLVLGGDTGPVHLAASLGSATVGIFTVTDPYRNGPLGSRVRLVSAVAPVAAVPSRQVRARPTHAVGAEEILSAARDLLST